MTKVQDKGKKLEAKPKHLWVGGLEMAIGKKLVQDGEELIKRIVGEYKAQRKAGIEDFCFEWFLEGLLKGKLVADKKWLEEQLKLLPRRNYKKGACVGWVEDILTFRDNIEELLGKEERK